MKMNAIRFYGPNNLKYEQVDIKEPNDDEILVKVKAALTCGTDIKTFRRGHPVLIKEIPSGFGHEFSGIVEKTGKNITHLKPGDRVVCANSAPCYDCYYCRIGKYNLCENLEFLNGAYAEYVLVPAQIAKYNTYKIQDTLSFAEAALTEPFANVVHGFERTGINKGDTVGIVGIGPIGLMFIKLAKAKGARVIAAGRNPLKLKMAKEFAGADEVINLRENPNPQELVKNFSKEGKGLDFVIEAVGLPEIWEQVFSLVHKGGTVHLFGGCKSGSTVTVDTRRIHYDEISVISVFHHTPEYFKKSLNLIASGEIDLKPLITAKMPLRDAQKALEMQEAGKALKVLIEP